MDLHTALRTTFSCRSWTDDPVDDATLYRILEQARFAPNGGNRQGQHVIVLKDREKRLALVPLVRECTDIYMAQTAAGEAPWNSIVPTSVDEAAIRAADGPVTFPGVNELVDAPIVLVITLDLAVAASFDKELDRVGVISGASIYPFVWSILLAARGEGLAGVPTTYLADKEPEVQKLLGIPAQHAVAAMVPLGVPVKQLTKLRRNPVSSFATIDSFDGAVFNPTDEG